MEYPDVLEFWFNQVKPDEWFKVDEMLDLKMVEKFIAIHAKATAGELYLWRDDPLGRLAEIILLDQFSRNIYRGEAKAYATDPMALVLAQETIYGNHHKNFDTDQKIFLYLPFMHSESKIIHEVALKLFSEEGLEDNLRFELEHKGLIDRYGRYPERNQILGRNNTADEEKYLMGLESEKKIKSNAATDERSLH